MALRSEVDYEVRLLCFKKVVDGLLVSQVVLNRMALPVKTGAKLGDLAPSGYGVIGGEAMCTDEWDGYPAERDALVRVIAGRGPGVVTVSGDVHSAWAFEGPCLDGDPVAVEFVTPCVTATPMGQQLPRGWRKLLGGLAERLPEARWFELEHHGYLVVEVDRDEARAHWFTVDGLDPDASPEYAAGWRHRRDRVGRLDPLDPPEAVQQAARRRRSRRRLTALAGALTAIGAAVAGRRAWLRLGDGSVT